MGLHGAFHGPRAAALQEVGAKGPVGPPSRLLHPLFLQEPGGCQSPPRPRCSHYFPSGRACCLLHSRCHWGASGHFSQGVRLTSQDTHLTPQTSPPQRPVPVVSQGAGGAVEGEGTGAAGAGGAGSRGAGGVGVEATPVEDTATSSQRSHLASPPGFPSVLACLCGWLLRSLGVCLREVLEEMAEEDPRLQQQVRLQPQQERLEEEPLPQQQGQVLYVRGNDTCG
ncbi:unnamed protein product [Closterium sp. NIES-54]